MPAMNVAGPGLILSTTNDSPSPRLVRSDPGVQSQIVLEHCQARPVPTSVTHNFLKRNVTNGIRRDGLAKCEIKE